MAKITQEEAEAMLQRNNIAVTDENIRLTMTMVALDISEDFLKDSFNVSPEVAEMFDNHNRLREGAKKSLKSFSTRILDALLASGKTLLITNSQREGEKSRVDVDLVDKDTVRNILSMGPKHSIGAFQYDRSRIVRFNEQTGETIPSQHEGGSSTKH